MFCFIFQNFHVLVIGRFRLNGKSRKAFNIIMSTKSVFFDLERVLQAGSPSSRGCFLALRMDSRRTLPQTELLYILAVTHMLCACEILSSIVDLDQSV